MQPGSSRASIARRPRLPPRGSEGGPRGLLAPIFADPARKSQSEAEWGYSIRGREYCCWHIHFVRNAQADPGRVAASTFGNGQSGGDTIPGPEQIQGKRSIVNFANIPVFALPPGWFIPDPLIRAGRLCGLAACPPGSGVRRAGEGPRRRRPSFRIAAGSGSGNT
jgi:hypothetical protein